MLFAVLLGNFRLCWGSEFEVHNTADANPVNGLNIAFVRYLVGRNRNHSSNSDFLSKELDFWGRNGPHFLDVDLGSFDLSGPDGTLGSDTDSDDRDDFREVLVVILVTCQLVELLVDVWAKPFNGNTDTKDLDDLLDLGASDGGHTDDCGRNDHGPFDEWSLHNDKDVQFSAGAP